VGVLFDGLNGCGNCVEHDPQVAGSLGHSVLVLVPQMKRLNDRAFDILQTEIRRCTSSEMAGQVQCELALRRLEKFRLQSGSPLTYLELKEALSDLIPDFNDRILRKAAQANRPPSTAWFWFKTGTLTLGLLTGGIWLVNRPIPWIRYPVAQVAPFLLTPSYMAMDHNYKSAIALVQQADQLIDQATAFEDLDLGTQTVKAAQTHLDELPAWYLGHFPGDYCRWAACSWRFTFDEFRSARESIARLDARLFQEKNAQTRFEQADQSLTEAMHLVRSTASLSERDQAIVEWRTAMDTLRQLPSTLLAGRLAVGKVAAAERDFEQVAHHKTTSQQSGRLLELAQTSANVAKKKTTEKPMTISELEQVRDLWTDAIADLSKIKDQDPDSITAKLRLIDYREKLSRISDRLRNEKTAVEAFDQAKFLRDQLLMTGDPKLVDRQYVVGKLEAIATELRNVKPGTTVFSKAQQLKTSAENHLKDIR
jgi:tetratricopeptide (TPR) repeat protein